jgi:ribonucleoside-triphosphate reductase
MKDYKKMKFKRLRRITGYLTGDYETKFNDSKQAEVRDRVKHA